MEPDTLAVLEKKIKSYDDAVSLVVAIDKDPDFKGKIEGTYGEHYWSDPDFELLLPQQKMGWGVVPFELRRQIGYLI